MAAVEERLARADGPSSIAATWPTGAVRMALVSAAILAVWILAASHWVLTDTVVPWDSKNQFYAFFRFLASALHSGASPFWNPYHYGGHPSIADPQSLIFAPAFVLWALFDPKPSIRTFDLIVYAHLLAGGLAVGLLGTRWRWPAAACVLAAVVFMFGGVAAGRLQHTGAILSYALFPPALLLLQVALARRSMSSALAFSVVAAALVLGRNQTAMLLTLVLAAGAMAEIATAERPLRYLRERLPVLMVMAILTFALVAVPYLLTLQFASLSNRPVVLLDQALKGSLHPLHLAQMAVPNIFGVKDAFWGPGPASIPDIAYTDDSFSYWFVGAVPVVLLLWLGIAGGAALRRGRILLTATLAVALLYALGRYTPFYGWAFEWLPGVNKFRRPIDADFVVMAALAILTGHLLTDYVRSGLPRGRMIANLVVGGAALALVAWGVTFSAKSGHGWDAFVEVLKSAAIAAGVMLALLIASTPRARSATAVLLTLVAIAELMWWNVGFRLNSARHSGYAVLETPNAVDTHILNLVGKLVRERQAAGERPRIEMIGMGGAWQNVAMVRGLEATNGYNPLRNGVYDKLVAPGESNWLSELRDFPVSFDSYNCALSRALGLEFIVLDRPIDKVPHLARRTVPEVIKAGPKAWVYRLQNPMPRLKFTRHVQVADVDAMIGTGKAVERLAADRVLIDDDTPPKASYAVAPAGNAGSAVMTRWRHDRVEIDAASDSGGMLVLHDVYYPGWVAEIDGKRTPILRADVLFRGVEVPPGRHQVVFRFAPLAPDNLWAAFKGLIQRR